MKALLDEMYPRLIADALRTRGHDVVSAHEAPGSGATDVTVLDYARSEGSAVVTENVRDYRSLADALHTTGQSHAGLVFTTEKRWPRRDAGALITALDALLASSPEQALGAELWL